jgi:hypothetical protein
MADPNEERRKAEAERKAQEALDWIKRNEQPGGGIDPNLVPPPPTPFKSERPRSIVDDFYAVKDWAGSRAVDLISTIMGAPKSWQDTARHEHEIEDAWRKSHGLEPRKPLIDVDTTLPASWDEKEIAKRLHKVSGITPTPTPTVAGPYVDAGIKGAALGLPFGGLSRLGSAANFLSSAAAQGVGDLPGVKGSVWEPVARMAAGAGVGLGVSAPSMLRTTESKLVRDATKGMDKTSVVRLPGGRTGVVRGDDNWAAAEQRQRESDRLLNATEAVVGGTSDPLALLTRKVISTGHGGAITDQMRDRLPLLDQRFADLLEKLAPGGKVDLTKAEPNIQMAST